MRDRRKLLCLTVLLAGAAASAQRGMPTADELAHGGPLQVRVQPAEVRLGADSGAAVEVQFNGELNDLVVTTNHGSISNLRRVAPGRWRADYLAPPQRFPHVAIVSATTSSGQLGFRALPLWGQGEALVRTRPNAEVSVRLGPQVYGPIKADAKGRGKVPVVVPPGVNTAFYGTTAIDLGLPRVSRMHLVADRQQASTDQQTTAKVWMLLATPQGRSEEQARWLLEPSAGVVGEVIDRGGGLYETTWTLEPGPIGDVTLKASLANESTTTATLGLRRLTGRPTTLALTVTPERVTAGAGAGVVVDVLLQDAGGNPTEGPVAIEATLGKVSAPRPVGVGRYRSTIEVPDRFEGSRSFLVRARIDAGPSAEQQVALVAADPASVASEPARVKLAGDERKAHALTLTVRDRFGNTVETEGLRASAAQGDVQLSKLSPGQYAVAYTPPSEGAEGEDAIRFDAGTATGTAIIDLAPRPSPWTLAPRVGVVTNLGATELMHGAVEAGRWFSLSGTQLGLLAEGGYAAQQRQTAVEEGSALAGTPVRIQLSMLPLVVSAAWRAALLDRLELRAAVGAGLTWLTIRLTLNGQPSNEATRWLPSAHASAALRWKWLLGGPFLEARLWWHPDPGTAIVSGPLVALAAAVGYRFELR